MRKGVKHRKSIAVDSRKKNKGLKSKPNKGGKGGGGGGADTNWYYVDDGGDSQGPFTSSELLGWVEQGVLTADRQVQNVDGGDWCDMSEQMSLMEEESNASGGRDASASMAEEDEGSSWYYLDEANALQGPFPSAQILGWFDAGAMPGDLQCCKAGDSEYADLSSYAEVMRAEA
jgi:hypothetical protein